MVFRVPEIRFEFLRVRTGIFYKRTTSNFEIQQFDIGTQPCVLVTTGILKTEREKICPIHKLTTNVDFESLPDLPSIIVKDAGEKS